MIIKHQRSSRKVEFGGEGKLLRVDSTLGQSRDNLCAQWQFLSLDIDHRQDWLSPGLSAAHLREEVRECESAEH